MRGLQRFGAVALILGLVAATLSLRNTDPTHPIRITSVRYVDSQGQTVREYLEKPLQLGSLSATRFLVPESDVVGGSGASFIVKWQSDKLVTEPVIEAVMVGTASNQGISFISHGRVIQEVTK